MLDFKPEVIIMDIEGTTTDIRFVHKTLFPYSFEKMEEFVKSNLNNQDITPHLESASQELGFGTFSVEKVDQIIGGLRSWISKDLKHGSLKAIQGALWKKGYESGAYTGHIYDDVLPMWTRWNSLGMKLGIYSSGSVQAQKLLFGHTSFGDLNPHLEFYFDTKVGHKRDPQSFSNICTSLNVLGRNALFLSDIEEELDAAMVSGIKTIHVVREGTQPSKKHDTISSFEEIGF